MKTLYCFLSLKFYANRTSIGETREICFSVKLPPLSIYFSHNYSIVMQDVRMTSPPDEEVADDGYVTISVYSYGLAGTLSSTGFLLPTV